MEKTAQVLDFIMKAIVAGATDIYVRGTDVHLRLPEGVVRANQMKEISPDSVRSLVQVLNDPHFMPVEVQEALQVKREANFAVAIPSADPKISIRLRVHAFYAEGEISRVIRIIPVTPTRLTDLGFDEYLEKRIVSSRRGLIMITGTTGTGKSTTLAAILQHLSITQPLHIITLEDPIEYVIRPEKSLVHQRELFTDFYSFPDGVRSVLRESPDVVMIGEVRDLDTLRWTLSLAEAGFLVFATYHTRTPKETIERIVGSFPEAEQNQARTRLASTLVAVVSQVLLPTDKTHGSNPRAVAYEYMFTNDSIRTLIRDGRTHQITNEIGKHEVGVRLEETLARLVRNRIVTKKTAEAYVQDPGLFNQRVVSL